jgi:two-component system, OmpR family, heavy metal sensor histidine kinase CusS
MKPRTFRARLMILSVAVSGVALLGFGLWAWQVLHSLTGLHRLDGDLVALARSQAENRPHGREWPAFEQALDGLALTDATRRFSFLVLDRQGWEIYRSATWPETLAAELSLEHPDSPPPHPATIETVSFAQSKWRAALLRTPHGTLVVAVELAPYLAEVRALRYTFLLVFFAALVCVGGGSWLLAWRALRPVDTLAAAAEAITAQDLDRRIPKGKESEEFARLIDVFNEMLERLEGSFNHATRFSADAAHELKTPLTILQGQLDQALQEAPVGSPLQENLGRLLEEVQRLKIIIRRLLLLSLADAGRIRVALAPTRLDELLDQVIEDVSILAPSLKLVQELEEDVWVDADEALLQQAIQNLVNNAIKYNVDEGKIRFQLFRHENNVRFAIANTSDGIPEEQRKQVFHRFYRADPAHSRKVDGVGLGLSLAREILRAHGGKLWLADAPEDWVMFVMELPARGNKSPKSQGHQPNRDEDPAV